MAADAPEVSVVIPTRDRVGVVATLESIFANAHPSFEVLLVDQSADSDTERAVSSFLSNPRFRYIPSATRGAASARNVGLSQARAGIVAFTDDDCLVPADWLVTITSLFAEHPDAVLLLCDVAPAAHDVSAGVIPQSRYNGTRHVRRVSEYIGHVTMSAGMAVRLRPILDIGGFDETFGPGALFMCAEDFDLVLRVLVNRWTIYETDRVSIVHLGYRSLDEFRELSRRDWFAVGAVHAKHLKCSHWSTLIVLAYNLLVKGICQPLVSLARLRKPHGLRRPFYFWRGFLAGYRTPVDREWTLYTPEG
jgi:glycosyltransferase involved in cell wall biosynthesis